MREAPRDPERLRHIITAIDNAIRFTEGKTFEDLQANSILFFGTVKNVEIIGEASYMLTSDFKERHSATPWKRIVGLRHVFVHEYYQIMPKELMNVVQNDLPPLRKQVVEYLKEFEATEGRSEGN